MKISRLSSLAVILAFIFPLASQAEKLMHPQTGIVFPEKFDGLAGLDRSASMARYTTTKIKTIVYGGDPNKVIFIFINKKRPHINSTKELLKGTQRAEKNSHPETRVVEEGSVKLPMGSAKLSGSYFISRLQYSGKESRSLAVRTYINGEYEMETRLIYKGPYVSTSNKTMLKDLKRLWKMVKVEK